MLKRTRQCHVFKNFFEEILNSTEQGEYEDFLKINQLLDTISAQITLWLASTNHSINQKNYALNVMKAIEEASLPNDKRLLPIKAKLTYLRGIIHSTGFETIPKQLNQALFDFKDAAYFGSIEAQEKLGDAYFAKALLAPRPISNSSDFQNAIIAYSTGKIAAKRKLVENCYMTLFNDALQQGKIDEAVACIELIHDTAAKEHFGINPKLSVLCSRKKHLKELKLAIEHAQKISAHYILAIEQSPDKMLDYFLKIQDELKGDGDRKITNPAFDYYHAIILEKIERIQLKNSSLDSKLIEPRSKHARDLFQKITSSKNYPEHLLPLQQFIMGVGTRDLKLDLGKRMRSSKAYFKAAAKQGCFLAYSYLGDIAIDENQEDAEYFYTLGALAGDPRCQFSYYHRYLARKAQSAAEHGGPSYQSVKEREKTLNILEAALHNPLTVHQNKDYLIENISLIKDLLEKPEILCPKSWEKFYGDATVLINFLEQYALAPKDDFPCKISILEAISRECNKYSEEKFSEEKAAANKKLISQLNIEVGNLMYYLNKRIYLKELSALSKITPKGRIKHFFNFFTKKGAMKKTYYYMEAIDPLHRKPELLILWANSPTKKSFFSWLLSYDSFDTGNTDRVPYLSIYQRQRLLLSDDKGTLKYSMTKSVPDDGLYLYVFDTLNNLYIASEAHESSDHVHFQHSSFLSGQSVQCAGDIVFSKGKIVEISNGSGHYLPNIEQLHSTINVLKNRGVLSENLKIKALGTPVVPGLKYDMNNLSLEEFEDFYCRFSKKILKPSSVRPSKAITKHGSFEEKKGPNFPRRKLNLKSISSQIDDYIQYGSALHGVPDIRQIHQDKLTMIKELNQYILLRIQLRNDMKGSEYKTNFGFLFGHSASTKISAARRMIQFMKEGPLIFNDEEINALNAGELGNIIKKYRNKNLFPNFRFEPKGMLHELRVMR